MKHPGEDEFGNPNYLFQYRTKAWVSPLSPEIALINLDAGSISNSISTESMPISIVSWKKDTKYTFNFLNESFSILSEHLRNDFNGDSKTNLEKGLAISKEFSSLLRKHSKLSSEKELNWLSGLHNVWSVFELVLFPKFEKVPILNELWSCLSHNGSENLNADFEEVVNCAQPVVHPKFWRVITSCVMRCHFEAVELLLKPIENTKSNGFHTPIKLFLLLAKQYPKFEDFSTISTFRSAWHKWRQDIVFNLELFSSNDIQEDNQLWMHVQTLFKIVSGENSSIFSSANSWVELLMSILFFQSPLADSRQLAEIVGINLDHLRYENILDQTLIAILQQDIGRIIDLTSQLDPWLVTHLVPVLELSGLLEEIMPASLDETISQWYIVEFAEHLLTDFLLWEQALKYFSLCQSREVILSELIPRLACILDCIGMENRIFEFCADMRLNGAAQELHRTLARKALQKGNYVKVITHLLESDDFSVVSSLAEELFELYLTNDQDSLAGIIDSLKPDQIIRSQHLVVFAWYRQFQKSYIDGDYRQAADTMVKILTSNIVPKKFLKFLLLDSLPLLEGEVCVFESNQVLELMRFVEVVELFEKEQRYSTADSLTENSTNELDLLKLALTRCFASSMVMEC
jgi:hypothetical protein